MTITPRTLTRSAGIAAVAARAIFIGVQLHHPPLDAASVKTTEWAVRSSLKVLMAALALVGVTGMYLDQVKRMGLPGLIGYVLFAANYIVIGSVSFIAAYVLPSIADSSPGYVKDALAFPNGIAMIALGYALWRIIGPSATETTKTTHTVPLVTAVRRPTNTASNRGSG